MAAHSTGILGFQIEAMMRLSARAKTKAEASRWIRRGLELAVIDPNTNRPAQQNDGEIEVIELGWIAKVILKDGLVVKIK